MKTFAIDGRDLSIRLYSSKKEASSYGNSTENITSAEDLEASTISTSNLVAIFNKLSSFYKEKEVSRFSDRKTAAKRTFALIEKYHEGEEEEFTDEDMAEIESEISAEINAVDLPEKAPKKDKAAPKPTKKGRKSSNRDKPLVINTNREQPYRVGTKSGATWALIVANPEKTFNEYVEMGGRANTISDALRNEYLKIK